MESSLRENQVFLFPGYANVLQRKWNKLQLTLPSIQSLAKA